MDKKLFEQICIVSREGVCLMDMGQVIEAAKRKGLHSLAVLVERELENKQTETGEYARAIKPFYSFGEQSS